MSSSQKPARLPHGDGRVGSPRNQTRLTHGGAHFAVLPAPRPGYLMEGGVRVAIPQNSVPDSPWRWARFCPPSISLQLPQGGGRVIFPKQPVTSTPGQWARCREIWIGEWPPGRNCVMTLQLLKACFGSFNLDFTCLMSQTFFGPPIGASI